MRPKDLLNQCLVWAQNDSLKIYRIGQAANYDVELLRLTHNLLVHQWNEEVDQAHNRYGHHTNPFTMNRYQGIRLAIGKAMAEAQDRAYRRGQKRGATIPRGGPCGPSGWRQS
jgi:hypothetical protein